MSLQIYSAQVLAELIEYEFLALRGSMEGETCSRIIGYALLKHIS